MKAILCFAFLAVAAAIPLKDSEQISIPEGPISFEMLRNAAAFPMPVWRDLPIHILPEGDVFIAVPIPDAMLRGPIPNFPGVQIIDAFGVMPSNDASEIASNDIVPSAVNVVYAAEPGVSSDAVDAAVAGEINPNSDIVPDKVKIVYAPEIAMLSEDNVNVPDVAREINPNSEVNVVYAVEPEVSEDKHDAQEPIAPEVVNFVDEPAFDLKNMKVPINARDIV